MYINGHKLKKTDFFIVALILLGAWLIGWACYTTTISSLGDPYSNRAAGAASICPATMGGDGYGNTWFVYACENDEQRLAAAAVTQSMYNGKAAVYTWISVASYFMVMFWLIWSMLKKRPAVRRYSRYSH